MRVAALPAVDALTHGVEASLSGIASPLTEAIAKSDATVESVVELTDIGGPTMVRSAAKGGRIVVCRFEDRQTGLAAISIKGQLGQAIYALAAATVDGLPGQVRRVNQPAIRRKRLAGDRQRLQKIH